MPRAILRNGQIQPIDPLPPDWKDGTKLSIEAVQSSDEDDMEAKGDSFNAKQWLREMKDLCADADPEDDARLQAAIDQIRRQGKEIMRKEMGL